jgi:hypothetical protein
MKRACILPFIFITALLLSATACSKSDDTVAPEQKPVKPGTTAPLLSDAVNEIS